MQALRAIIREGAQLPRILLRCIRAAALEM
jgi:hypothetical protein